VPPVRGDRIEGRNVVFEALSRRRRRVRRVWLDAAAKLDERVAEILALAREVGAPVERVERSVLDRMSLTGVHNGVIAEGDPLPQPSLKELIDRVPEPFFVLVDEVQ
jgi:23S rRNA (guanosine2251-2'-O)-methyltransferase